MSTPKAYSYIRFSTPEQEKGHSLRRQEDAANEYAKKRKLDLISLKDEGLSGHSGAHITKGDLGKFIKWVKEGKVERGSALIIENIDRLTRLRPIEAERLFYDILTAGITIVVVDEYAEEGDEDKFKEITEKTYDGKYYNEIKGEIRRAYKESKRKSETISKSRNNEREQARKGKKLISGMPPMWLEFNEDQTDFIPKDEVVDAINLIFQMKVNGKGSYRIERELNQMDNVWSPKKSKRNKAGAWRKSTINRYLKDRRLLGEYQPHKYINNDDGSRERVKAGELIPDYYPAVIDKKLFDRVQGVIKENSRRPGNAGGRADKINNLFTHLVKCGACGDSMRYVDKSGGRPKLQCDDNYRGLECEENRKVRYDTIAEPLLLEYCRGLDVSDILPGNEKRQTELASLQKKRQEIEGELSQVNTGIKNLIDKIELGEEIAERYQQRKAHKDELEDHMSKLDRRIKELNNATDNTAQRLQDIQELIERLEQVEGEERKDLRLNVRAKLQQIIKRIDIGFGKMPEYGQPFVAFEIKFKDDVERTLVVVDGKLDEVITIDGGNVDTKDIQRERQRESNFRVAEGLRRAQKNRTDN